MGGSSGETSRSRRIFTRLNCLSMHIEFALSLQLRYPLSLHRVRSGSERSALKIRDPRGVGPVPARHPPDALRLLCLQLSLLRVDGNLDIPAPKREVGLPRERIQSAAPDLLRATL